jgi:diguanylate cyclase (GGDEF)-like protein
MRYSGRLVMTLWVLINLVNGYIMFLSANFTLFVLVEVFSLVPLGIWIGLQYDKAKFLSERDSLTGMYNRRFVHRAFAELCTLSDRHRKSMACLILDVNDLKTINDTHGHDAGDLVLKNVSGLLMEFTRKSDIVARWGGDEFLMIIPLIDSTGVAAMISRLYESFEKMPRRYHTNRAVSIGAAVYPEDGLTIDELIRIADQDMYRDKSK